MCCRSCYITPKLYLDLLQQYSTLLSSAKAELGGSRRRLLDGIAKLSETNAALDAMQAQLNGLRPLLVEKTASTSALLKQVRGCWMLNRKCYKRLLFRPEQQLCVLLLSQCHFLHAEDGTRCLNNAISTDALAIGCACLPVFLCCGRCALSSRMQAHGWHCNATLCISVMCSAC